MFSLFEFLNVSSGVVFGYIDFVMLILFLSCWSMFSVILIDFVGFFLLMSIWICLMSVVLFIWFSRRLSR